VNIYLVHILLACNVMLLLLELLACFFAFHARI
jgi:hypothetical protein